MPPHPFEYRGRAVAAQRATHLRRRRSAAPTRGAATTPCAEWVLPGLILLGASVGSADGVATAIGWQGVDRATPASPER